MIGGPSRVWCRHESVLYANVSAAVEDSWRRQLTCWREKSLSILPPTFLSTLLGPQSTAAPERNCDMLPVYHARSIRPIEMELVTEEGE